MASLNTATIETIIQNKILELSISSRVNDLVLPVTFNDPNIGLSTFVANKAALPDLLTSSIPDGHVIFVDSINMHVVSSQGQWISFDGRVFRKDTPDRFIWAWGANTKGQLGDNTIISKSSPVSVVGGFTTWCQISSCRHSAALRLNRTLWTWGDNFNGQLGDNTDVSKSSPVSVAGGFTDWCQVSAGRCHTAAVRANGTLWTWGQNTEGRLGDNTIDDKSSPVSVVGGFTDWCQVSAGGTHTSAVRTNGTLWTWGYNIFGQLGDTTTVSKRSPVSVVGGFVDWCQVSAGQFHNAAIRTNGTLWTWGWNSYGRLGDNTTLSRSSPVSVVGGFTDWCQVSAGYSHTAAIRTNGTLWTWGSNGYGRLGDNTTLSRSSPVSVVGGFTNWCQVSVNGYFTAAVQTNGTLWTWGRNNCGQLGDNTIVNKSSPVSVVGGFTDWYRVSAGEINTLAIRAII